MTQQNDTRTHILTTGRALTAQRGYSGVGLSELLRAAGVPKGSFYHYFASKEAYGCALLGAFMTEYEDRLGGSLAHPDLDARARFLAYFDDWHRHQISPDPQDRCLVVKLSAEVADLSQEMSAILRDGIARIVARLSETLQQGIDEGSIAPLPKPPAMAQAIYHQWLGASLVASLSHDDAALLAARDMTRSLIAPG